MKYISKDNLKLNLKCFMETSLRNKEKLCLKVSVLENFVALLRLTSQLEVLTSVTLILLSNSNHLKTLIRIFIVPDVPAVPVKKALVSHSLLNGNVQVFNVLKKSHVLKS